MGKGLPVAMSVVLCRVTVGALRMELWESLGPRYTLVFRIMAEPNNVSITYLGSDRHEAAHIFVRKVECHRILAGP